MFSNGSSSFLPCNVSSPVTTWQGTVPFLATPKYSVVYVRMQWSVWDSVQELCHTRQ